MGTLDDEEIEKVNKEYTIYMWNVSESDYIHAIALMPEYIEFTDDVDLKRIVIENENGLL